MLVVKFYSLNRAQRRSINGNKSSSRVGNNNSNSLIKYLLNFSQIAGRLRRLRANLQIRAHTAQIFKSLFRACLRSISCEVSRNCDTKLD